MAAFEYLWSEISKAVGWTISVLPAILHVELSERELRVVLREAVARDALFHRQADTLTSEKLVDEAESRDVALQLEALEEVVEGGASVSRLLSSTVDVEALHVRIDGFVALITLGISSHRVGALNHLTELSELTDRERAAALLDVAAAANLFQHVHGVGQGVLSWCGHDRGIIPDP